MKMNVLTSSDIMKALKAGKTSLLVYPIGNNTKSLKVYFHKINKYSLDCKKYYKTKADILVAVKDYLLKEGFKSQCKLSTNLSIKKGGKYKIYKVSNSGVVSYRGKEREGGYAILRRGTKLFGSFVEDKNKYPIFRLGGKEAFILKEYLCLPKKIYIYNMEGKKHILEIDYDREYKIKEQEETLTANVIQRFNGNYNSITSIK